MRRVMNYDFVIFYDGGEADDITVLETNKENCEATVRILMSDIRFFLGRLTLMVMRANC